MIISAETGITLGGAIGVLLFTARSTWYARGIVDSIAGLSAKHTTLEARVENSCNERKKEIAEVRTELTKNAARIESLRTERAQDMDLLRAELGDRINGVDTAEDFTVLVVDDNADDRHLLCRMLRPKYNVISARSLKEASQQILHQKVDCVLLDLNLPDSDPLLTVSSFLKSHPSAVCVAISGTEDPNLIELARREGADSYLCKNNLDPRYVHQAIRHATLRRLSKQSIQ